MTNEKSPPVVMGAALGQAWLVSHEDVDMTRPARSIRPLSIPAEPQNIVIDAHKTALLIVDMQNDFCCIGGWLHSRGVDITPNRRPIGPIRHLVEACRESAVPVIWVNWGVRKDLLNIHPSLRHAHSLRGDEPGLAEAVPGTRSEVLARGSWGAEIVEEINPGNMDIQIVKHRFSAFWDTETDSILRNLGIKTLLIGGVNMDQCVMTTLEDASFLGYDTVLIEDATATTSPDYCVQAVLYNVKLLFGFVARSEAVLAAIDASSGKRDASR
jgi:ureidoacrylate peracid hydrolase